ncbi:MAG: GTP 3',8-cyclase MoaA [Deinococcota bacterium]
MTSLIDQHGRVVRDLRISITPRCNFQCVYCHPLAAHHAEPAGTLSLEDVTHVLRAATSLGMTSVRFTGGEPLLRRDLPQMIATAKELGVPDVAITTNATLLARQLPDLLAAGLDRVNISLDAVSEAAFQALTKTNKISQVWRGIDALFEADLQPVKLNAVVIRGVNDSEIIQLAELTRELPLHMRFIEYMHLNNSQVDEYQQDFFSGQETKARIEEIFGELEPVPTDPSAPARLFTVPGWLGKLGFINPISEPFCGACSRMRVTSDAKVRPCLLTDRELDARAALSANDPVKALQDVFLVAAHRKVASGITAPVARPRTMLSIGG